MSETTTTAEQEPLNPVSNAFRNLRADKLLELAQEIQGGPKGPESETGATETAETQTAESAEQTVLSHEEAPSTEAKPGEETAETETAETEEPGETEAAEEQEETHGLDPKTQERINKRIGKEVAKRKDAETERDTLKQQLQELEAKLAEAETAERPAQVVADPKQPLAHVQTAAQLAAEKRKAEEALTQAEDLLLELDSNPEQVEQMLKAAKIPLSDYSQASMSRFLKGIQLQANRTLRDAIPQREQFLKHTEAAHAEVFKMMPELKDRTSERSKLFQKVIANYPAIRNVPGWPMEVAIHVAGIEALMKGLAAPANKQPARPAAAAKKAPPKLPASVSAPVTQRTQVSDEPDQETVESAFKGDKSARLKVLSNLTAGLFR